MMKYPISREIVKRVGSIVSLTSKIFISFQHNPDIFSKNQPIFIIGVPRTGSTILYQILTNELDVLYIDNLTDILHPNILLGMSLSQRFFDNKPHNCFSSVEGDTWLCGLHAPSESGEFWYQYLPRDKHFIDYDDFDEKTIEKFQKQIFTVIEKFNKPLLLKNLNAGQRLRLINKITPNAKFIYIKRDFLDTAFSILNSRRKLGIKDNKWWSIKPNNYESLSGANVYELITNQIFYLEKQIAEDVSLFPQQNVSTFNYNDLYKNYNNIIDRIAEFIGAEVKISNDKIEPDLKKQNRSRRDKGEEEMFLNYHKKYDWNDTKIK